MQVSGETLAKTFGLLVTVGTAVGALFVRVGSLEDAKNGHADVLTEQRMELRKLSEKVDQLERERWNAATQMLERMNGVEKQLVEIKTLLRENERERSKRR